MRGLAALIDRGPLPAILVVAGSALVSMLLPPFTMVFVIIGGGAMVLITLRHGGLSGALVALAGVFVFGVLAMLLLRWPTAAALGMGITWLELWGAAWVAALVLRRSGSLPLALEAMALLLLLVGLGLFVFSEDLPASIYAQLEPYKDKIGQLFNINDAAAREQQLRQLAALATGGMLMLAMLIASLCVILGRALQAGLEHPGGLATEFKQLRFSRISAVLVLVLLVLSWLNYVIAANLLLLMMILYLFQGLAVIHAWTGTRPDSQPWTIGFYVIFILFLQVALMFVSLLGYVDAWTNIRRRLGIPSGTQGQS